MAKTIKPTAEDLDNRFNYHPAKGDQPDRYGLIRERCRKLAGDIVAITPVGREQSLALTSLEQAMFWANAGIARETP